MSRCAVCQEPIPEDQGAIMCGGCWKSPGALQEYVGRLQAQNAQYRLQRLKDIPKLGAIGEQVAAAHARGKAEALKACGVVLQFASLFHEWMLATEDGTDQRRISDGSALAKDGEEAFTTAIRALGEREKGE